MEQKDLQIFDFEGKQTRVVIVDGAPWWVGKDVCDVLGYANSRGAIEKHCKYASILKSTDSVLLDVPARGLSIIPESDVYRLIIRSNRPEAERFEEWIMEEVLPSIRKHGAYVTPQKIEEAAFNPDMLTTVIQALRDEQEALRGERDKASELEMQIEEQQSLVSFAESLQEDLSNQNTILIGGFRKILREGNMLFVWIDPSSEVKGIAPLSTAVNESESGDVCRLSLTDGGTQ